MTKKEKIRILERAIHRLVNSPHWYHGMCVTVGTQLSASTISASTIIESVRFLASVGIRRPKGKDIGDYWYPLNEEGKAKRISLLKAAIKRLQK